MSYFEGMHYALSLSRQVPFFVVLPNDVPPFIKENNPHYKRETKTIYLLHGMSETHRCFMNGCNLTNLANKYNVALLTPTADNSFYVNQKGTGRAYETYVGEEFVAFTRSTFGLSDKKENTYVAGISMGGYGALHIGLKYRDVFAKIAALSPALIQNEIKGIQPGYFNGLADYDFFAATFGDLDHFDQSDKNPEYQVKRLKEEGADIPPIYRICGTEDFLYEKNKAFGEFLKEQGVSETFKESPGIHDWVFWNQYMEDCIEWLVCR